MKLKNNDIEINTTDQGEINSLKFKDQEILHDSKNWWGKIYPMIWPNISFSKSFVVKGKNYKLPKHGFWKDLTWETIFENQGLSLLATHFANDVYPFTIDIQHHISIENNVVELKTTFSNISTEVAYFHFGHHPAFLIDAQTIVKQAGTLNAVKEDGKYTNQVFEMKPASTMEFGQEINTYVFKDLKKIDASFQAHNLKINIQSNDFNNLLVWRPEKAQFICVEPMQGQSDFEQDEPVNASDKQQIITLNPGATKEFKVKISIKKVN